MFLLVVSQKKHERCFEQGGEPGEIQAVNRVLGKTVVGGDDDIGDEILPSYIGIIS